MKVNVAVVSHGHSEILRKINCLPELSKMDDVNICVVDNVGEKSLYEWCKKSNIHYLKNERCRGFGENNNIAFKFFKEETDGDFLFLVMNPDIYIDNNELEKLKLISLNDNIDFATINLYKDYNYRFYDFSVRKYPAFVDFAMSILFGVNKTIVDKNSITKNTFVDWASGSFLLFTSQLYERLEGFDTKYYMYCEDIDICLRANLIIGAKLTYIPSVRAIHLAAHANRKLFSKNFIWHFSSAMRYLNRRRSLLYR